jgi:OPT oligopeptide transporter protein
MAATFAAYVLTQNMAITATFTHLILYNWEDLSSAFSFMSFSSLKNITKPSFWMFWKETEPTEEEISKMDPHYKLMQRYKDAPDWWYGLVVRTGIPHLRHRRLDLYLRSEFRDVLVGFHHSYFLGFDLDSVHGCSGWSYWV